MSWTPPFTAGSINLTAVVDPDNAITEANEANNSHSTTVTVSWSTDGYIGKRWTGGNNITTKRVYNLNGDVNTSFGNSNYGVTSTQWHSSDLPVPAGATITEARLRLL
jgi:subtilase family serine protease